MWLLFTYINRYRYSYIDEGISRTFACDLYNLHSFYFFKMIFTMIPQLPLSKHPGYSELSSIVVVVTYILV